MEFQYLAKDETIAEFERYPLLIQARMLAADGQFLLMENEQLLAHASLWWRETPAYHGEALGVIGHFVAASENQARQLLERCCAELRQQGCTLAVGPMDKNTWYGYRLTTWEEPSVPRFYLEPNKPAAYVDYFLAAGFQPKELYVSMLDANLHQDEPRYARIKEKFTQAGFRIRSFDSARFESELASIYHISVESFKHNVLYAPIAEREFFALYAPFKDAIVEPLILLAEVEGRPVGFVFAIPNFLEPETKTIVVKTIAVLPNREFAGLGAVLIGTIREQARNLGFERALFALVHRSNVSLALGNKYEASIIREYTLFARSLR